MMKLVWLVVFIALWFLTGCATSSCDVHGNRVYYDWARLGEVAAVVPGGCR